MIEGQQQMFAQLQALSNAVKLNQEIPAQVLFSKPVILLDARGQYMPFHLETVDSYEVEIILIAQ